MKRSHHSIGYNSRLDDIHAAVLRVKLKRVDEWSERRREIAALYDQGLAGAPMTLPFTPPGYQHVYHLYVVDSDDRDGLQAYLQSKRHYRSDSLPDRHPPAEGFPWGRPARVGALPVTEESAASVCRFPCIPNLPMMKSAG
jgi:dTDP-4-amino-4,6-dideoxygalactose transaminase